MPIVARSALAALAGVALGVSFEPLRLVYLLPFALAVFSLGCRGLSLRRGFLVGWVFGSAFLLTLLPWLKVIGTDAWIMLSLFEALFYGLLGLGTAAVARLPWWPAWTAALWVAVEAFRGVFPFGGFPWGRLAFASVDTPVAPLMAYVGTAGVTFLVALVSTVLAWTILNVRRAPARASAVLVLTCLLAAVGSVLPRNSTASNDQAGPVTVAVVQGNVPGEGMNAFAERRTVLNNHLAATKELAARMDTGALPAPDIVVWPESSTDIDPFEDPTVRADISEAVDAVGVPVLVGAMVSGEGPNDVLNQGIVWHPGQGPGERYSKNHPVPFGEFIPFRDQLAKYFTRLDQIPRDMVPGTEPGLLEMNGTRVGDLICFEVAYDGLLRDVVRGGAELVVVQTNNATYMGTGQIEQQFAISRLRAIEANRTVVVAATNGVSGIVDPQGEVVQRAATRTQQVLVESVLPGEGVTPGIRFGIWIEWLLTLSAVAGLSGGIVVGHRRRRTSTGQPRPERTAVDA